MSDWKLLLGASVVGLGIPTFVGGGDACRARNEAILGLTPRIMDHVSRENLLFGVGRLLLNSKGEADELAKGFLTMALKAEGDLLSCSAAFYKIKIAPDSAAQHIATQLSK